MCQPSTISSRPTSTTLPSVLSTKQCLKKLSYAVAPFLFAVNFATVIDPFSSFAVVLLIALLFSAVSFFLLFIILIGDSVYEDEEEE